MLFEFVHGQQMELEVLHPRADGGTDLLRIGGGQDEHDVCRGFLERLEQRCLSAFGQHVHFVEDVHLVSAGGAERCLLDEVAHRVDTVVARGIEFVHVVTGAGLDSEARGTLAAGLTIDGVGAVQHFRKNARRGGLAGSAGPAEQVSLTFALVDHGIA